VGQLPGGPINAGGSLSPASLPSFWIHGFPETTYSEEKQRVEKQQKRDIETHLKETNAQFLQSPPETVIRVDTGEGGIETTTIGAYTDSLKESIRKLAEKEHTYAKALSDISPGSDGTGNLDLTQMVTDIQWETMTSAPYANATVTLRLHPGIVHYVFQGADANHDGEEGNEFKFRHIETGGWASIRFGVMVSGKLPLTHYPSHRTVFFGKILSINLKTEVNAETGIASSVATVTLGSFITPLSLGETNKTVFRKGAISMIDPAAMGGYTAGTNRILEALIASLKRGGSSGQDMYDALHNLIVTLGHMQLPTSIAGLDKNTGRPHRLGNHIGIMGNFSDTMLGTIYRRNASDINRISTAIIKEQYFAGAFRGGASAIWSIIQQLFQPEKDMIELFPVMIPLGEEGSADSRAAGDGGSYDGKNGFQNSVLTESLQAVPYIMYRYKPLPPDFHGTKAHVNSNFSRTQGLRAEIKADKTYHEGYFSNFNPTSDMGLAQFINVDKQKVLSVDLTWSETHRVNAVHLGFPFSTGTGNNLFGVECVPVFNIEDINRNGLRMINSTTPFREKPYVMDSDLVAVEELMNGTKREQRRVTPAGKTRLNNYYAGLKEQRNRQRTSSSAHAERMYYLVGEGHAYADGQVVLTYNPDPDLIAGIWCRIKFTKGDTSLEKALTFYCTAVRHQVGVDAHTGVASGLTVLTIERASYGNRIPAVDLNQVPMQMPPAPSEDKGKKEKKKPTRKGRK
jgi:hypothetical protein